MREDFLGSMRKAFLVTVFYHLLEEVIPSALRHKRECRLTVVLVNTKWADLGRNETQPRPDPTCTMLTNRLACLWDRLSSTACRKLIKKNQHGFGVLGSINVHVVCNSAINRAKDQLPRSRRLLRIDR